MDIEKMICEMTLEEKAALCSGSDFWHTKSVERLGIPSIMMCDGPHGLRKQEKQGDHLGLNDSIKAVCFPTAVGLGSSFDRTLLHRLGVILGKECQAFDISMLLGPGMNIKRSPLCGRNFEYFSEDPYLSGQLAAAYVQGLQSKGVAACPKHFAANNQETRRMSGSSQVDERTLHEIYLSGFEDMVKESSPRSIMCSYNQINGTFSSENRKLLTDILRSRWGFKGFVVTDWGAGKDCVKGIHAGVDLVMPGGDNPEYVAKVVKSVKDGTLPQSELDGAVRNILHYVSDYLEKKDERAKLSLEADHASSTQIAAECAVLLKNENHVLPLGIDKKVAFVGAFAKEPRYQGAGSSHINTVKVVGSVEAAQLEGISVLYAQGYDPSESDIKPALVEQAVEIAKVADTVVIFAGLPEEYESEGFDRTTMAMPDNQIAVIEAVAAANRNTVVVLYNGAPVEMPWADKVAAILELYLGGEGVGEAVVNLLYGKVNPSGKLAETFPVQLEDNPSYLNFPGSDGIVEYREGVFVGYRYYDKKNMEVRFPFGHGLSYTEFSYTDIWLDKEELNDFEQLTVKCKVKNIGFCSGKEVVQLYVSDRESRVNRPLRELKGFEKVELAPGEEAAVTFVLSKKAFAYYEPRIHDWFVESGLFNIEIGASSRDIRLSGKVVVNGTVKLPVHFTTHSTLGEIMSLPKGQEIIGRLLQQIGEKAGENGQAEAMGEGGNRMLQNMMMEMSFETMANFVGITEAQVHSLIEELNENQ